MYIQSWPACTGGAENWLACYLCVLGRLREALWIARSRPEDAKRARYEHLRLLQRRVDDPCGSFSLSASRRIARHTVAWQYTLHTGEFERGHLVVV